eukprot:TRINITY_DN6414_c0_g1_i5.p1 TRINITY_DN6414_c0_g1~~TRINITY_DN6414_c0_g1_i5.p1  ORF type:complete len:113 (-),score=13.06 TRINITY_DN6414_c0_g1_i5:37-375(-)
MALKAWLYYHTFCKIQNFFLEEHTNADELDERFESQRQSRKKFFEDHHLKEHDSQIIEYWVQVVLEQQACECSDVRRICLDYSICHTFSMRRGVRSASLLAKEKAKVEEESL